MAQAVNRRPPSATGFKLRTVHIEPVVEDVTLGCVSECFGWSPVPSIPPIPHIHSCTYNRPYTIADIDSVVKNVRSSRIT
jgi:hypothetical protein